MKPQIRCYILAVGRDKDDKPVRKLAAYRGSPLAGLTDDYERMNAAELRTAGSNLESELARIKEGLADVEAEKWRRLEVRAGIDRPEIERIMSDA